MYLKLDEHKSLEEIPDYYNFQRPHVIRGGCKSMKIFSVKDRLQLLFHYLKDDILQTEIYDTLTEMESTNVKKYIDQKFSKTFDNIVNDKRPHNYIADTDLMDPENMINNDLRQYFNYKIDTNRTNNGVLLFFGNNSRSGAHIHTGNDYVLNQIYGKKTIYMFDYYDNPIETFPLFSDRANFLKENLFKLDHSKLKIYKADLNEGDTITIPPWWWHSAQAEGLSMSITKTYPRSNQLFLLTHPRILTLILIEIFETYKSDIIMLMQYPELNILLILVLTIILLYIYVK
jgi:hypothetical protein